jgi:hypothetical protein
LAGSSYCGYLFALQTAAIEREFEGYFWGPYDFYPVENREVVIGPRQGKSVIELLETLE